ncbi:MAG: hypothetical protein PHZ18_12320 [Methanoculleus sp.]|nr:hypothetical protein [Methanoculleus sp.]MDD3217371.1 hypothetical protein [Methanoculleus sp.]MDD4313576.1 hypothetical protein [Methanoculleus sp.]
MALHRNVRIGREGPAGACSGCEAHSSDCTPAEAAGEITRMTEE